MKAMGPDQEAARSSALRKWGPLAAIAVVVAVVAGFLIVGGGDDEEEASGGPDTTAAATDGDVQLPEGVLPFSVAQERGEVDEIEWGDRCDTTEGVLALPLAPPPECFAPFEGDNGGATEIGVTAETIKVVVYLPQENDPILSFIYRQIGNNDTPDKVFQTYEGFNELMRTYYETYGRQVELVRYDATGNIGDEVAATADAETIARDIQPFAVLGGPNLTNAFADTLAANEILCISCTPGQPNDWYVERGPYVWDIGKNTDQNIQMVAEYVGKRLGGNPAQYGGDAVQDQMRRFGLIYASTGPNSEVLKDQFLEDLSEYDVTIEEVVAYEDPVGLAGQARDILARMKAKGVTSILFIGDPLAPQTLTQNATQQDYFPEWVITGSALVDTTIFSRTYDQQQWVHAFGPSNLFARISPTVAGSGFLWRWFYDGTEPPAQQSALILPNLQLLYAVLQGAGPGLTHQLFQDVIFNADIVPGTVIGPQISWGDRGIWPATDYAGLDDQTEVWWDADATGEDEIGNEGTGMWAYAKGGERYLPGEWPVGEPELFTDEGSVTLYTELPDGITLPDYEPLPPAG